MDKLEIFASRIFYAYVNIQQYTFKANQEIVMAYKQSIIRQIFLLYVMSRHVSSKFFVLLSHAMGGNRIGFPFLCFYHHNIIAPSFSSRIITPLNYNTEQAS